MNEQEEIEKQIEELKKKLPKKSRQPKRLPVAINPEEFELLMKATKKKKHKIAFLLGFHSGLRISETLKLEPRHIDIANKLIRVEQGKGSKDRIVPLPKYFKEDFLNELPLNVTTRAIQIAFKRACRRSGLLETKPSIHYHSLRHGFATHSLNQGIPIHQVKVLLGHSNVATTNVYLEMNPKDALKSYQELF
jgi:integrase